MVDSTAAMSVRCALVLLLASVVVLALVSHANAAPDPRPFDLLKKAKKLYKKVSEKLSPTLTCLKAAGAGDAALGYLQSCGQMGFYGKVAVGSCAATAYAPADVKALLKTSAQCFTKG